MIERAADRPVRVRGLPAPHRARARRERLAELATERRTIVSTRRRTASLRTLADLADALGADRPVVVARELTKLHETVVRGTLGDVELGEPRGEYVLVVAGAPDAEPAPDDDAIRAALRDELAAGASTRDAAAAVAPARRAAGVWRTTSRCRARRRSTPTTRDDAGRLPTSAARRPLRPTVAERRRR